ncbi:MAG: hypothetical protein P8Y03_26930 [Anaerolineales bacterium]
MDEVPLNQQFEDIARHWPEIPREVIACFAWREVHPTPKPGNVEALGDVDCSTVEWIEPQSDQGRQIGERLLSLYPVPNR